jgi:hypothetical protein
LLALHRLQARRLFSCDFRDVKVETYGNVLAAISFLEGLAVADVTTRELDVKDADYPVTIAVRAQKQEGV